MSAQEIPASPMSPCVKACRMHALSGFCEGCARTREEITEWSCASAPRRREILLQLPERHAQMRDLAALAAATVPVGKA